MYNYDLKEQRILDYAKNIEINTFFNENGKDINVVMKEIIINNCIPIERKKLEFFYNKLFT